MATLDTSLEPKDGTLPNLGEEITVTGEGVRFPSDIGEKDHIFLLTLYEVINDITTDKSETTKKENEKITTDTAKETLDSFVKKGVSTITNDIKKGISSVTTPIVTIALPMPLEISTTYNADWSGTSLNPLEYVLRDLINGGKDTSNLLSGGIKDIPNNVLNFMGNTASGNRIFASGATTLGKTKGIDINKSLGKITKLGINPYRELMYSSPSFRTFSFDWVLSPRNEQESLYLDIITRLIKKYMHPKTDGTSFEESMLYSFPAYCKVQFLSKDEENPFIFKIDDCAITSFTTRIDTKFHRDTNAPTAVSMNLSLTETVILSQSNFEERISY